MYVLRMVVLSPHQHVQELKLWYMYYIVRKHICVHTYQYLTILGNIYTVHFVQHHIFQIIHVTGS